MIQRAISMLIFVNKKRFLSLFILTFLYGFVCPFPAEEFSQNGTTIDLSNGNENEIGNQLFEKELFTGAVPFV